MGNSVVLVGLLTLCGNIYAAPNQLRPQERYGPPDAYGANDAEVGQLNGIFNALVTELQSAPKLAEGPQANANRELNEAMKSREPASPSPPPPATTTDATDTDDASPEPKAISLDNKKNQVVDAGMNKNNFNPPPYGNPSGPFPSAPNGNFGGNFGGNYGGGNYGGGGNPMMYPPFQQGPGPYDNPFMPPQQYNNYPQQYNNYQEPPPKQPTGNPGSFGSDNPVLQQEGLGQLGQFFSAMVGELQNSGFNNNVESVINPKRRPKAPVKSVTPKTAATTASSSKTTTSSDDERK